MMSSTMIHEPNSIHYFCSYDEEDQVFDNSENSENSENGVNSENSENSENGVNSENSENSENGENSENSENGVNSENSENSENGVNSENSENGVNSENSENSENGVNSENSENSENGVNSESSEYGENSENSEYGENSENGSELSEIEEMNAIEPILQENPNRFVLFPIQYPLIWEHYKTMRACDWNVEEIDFSNDYNDWEKLNSKEKHFIKNILAFFAGSDGIVLENLINNFSNEIQIPEARCAYGQQAAIENVHSETYSLMIDTYVKDPLEKKRLFNGIETIPCVKEKAEWALRWLDNSELRGFSFARRLVAFAAVEGIFFSGSFCAIYWLKKRGIMPGLTFSNELISRDEGQHTELAVLLYQLLNKKLDYVDFKEIIKSAVVIEKKFIIDSLPCELIGMNSKLMSEYIEFVADRLVVQFGYEKIWGTKNPFDFMELISLAPKANFFERRVSQYVKAGVGKSQKDNEISFDDEDSENDF
jgi:ribonucleoside-diphosphate reductase beta chain